MGVVYHAWDGALDREVAIKVLKVTDLDADDLSRFRNEARIAASLHHPNIVGVQGMGFERGRPYLVMDFVEGESLADAARAKGALPPRRAAELAETLARALHYAHGHGILHRDVKPQNVLLRYPEGTPLLTDFGLAKVLGRDTQITLSGEIMGTPVYMPPEQARADHDAIGPTADVYSLGATLYGLITGDPPFRGTTLVDVMDSVLNSTPASPSTVRHEIDPALSEICLRCLEKDPSDRYPTALALAEALNRYRTGNARAGKPGVPHRAVAGAIAATLALGVGLGALLGLQGAGQGGGAPQQAAPDSAQEQEPEVERLRAEHALARRLAQKAGADLDEAESALIEERDARRQDAARHVSLQEERERDLRKLKLRTEQAEARVRELDLPEETEVKRILDRYEGFQSHVALDMARGAARRQPHSKPIQAALARILAMHGRLKEARIAHKLSEGLSTGSVHALGRYLDLALGAGGEAFVDARHLGRRWQPAGGALWTESAGVISARGFGLGQDLTHSSFFFSSRVDGHAGRVTEPYECEVDVRMDYRPRLGLRKAFAGILFAGQRPNTFYFAILLSWDPKDVSGSQVSRSEAEAHRAKTGGWPKWLRFGSLRNGLWNESRRNLRADFPDDAWAKLKLRVDQQKVSFEVNGKTLGSFKAPGAQSGRVGLIRFFDTIVDFRGWNVTRHGQGG
jgi:hypothetical protein